MIATSKYLEHIKDLETKLLEKDIILKEKDNILKEKEHILKEKEIENNKYKEELQTLKEKTYEEIDKPGHVYILKCDGGYKIGKTKDNVNKRIKGLQTGNVNKIETIMDCETSNEDLLEKIIHYILDKYRTNSNREFFDCDINYIKLIIDIVNTTIDTMKSTFKTISKEELYNIFITKIKAIKDNYEIEEYEDEQEEIDDNKEVIKLLKEKYNSGNTNDFVKLADIKKTLKEYNIIIDKITIINILQKLFLESEYYDRKQIGEKRHRSIFVNIKTV